MTPAGRPQSPPRTPFETNLRELMRAAEIPTYAELARRSGTTIVLINAICSGRNDPSVGTLRKLATALNCSLDALVTFSENT